MDIIDANKIKSKQEVLDIISKEHNNLLSILLTTEKVNCPISLIHGFGDNIIELIIKPK